MNKVVLLGRLVRDPESKGSNGSKSVCRFTVACDRPKAKDADKAEADFISCVAFDKTADVVARYFKKGSRILIEDGKITTGSYTNKDGNKVYTTDVYAYKIGFVDSKSSSSGNTSSNSGSSMEAFGSAYDGPDIPF